MRKPSPRNLPPKLSGRWSRSAGGSVGWVQLGWGGEGRGGLVSLA